MNFEVEPLIEYVKTVPFGPSSQTPAFMCAGRLPNGCALPPLMEALKVSVFDSRLLTVNSNREKASGSRTGCIAPGTRDTR